MTDLAESIQGSESAPKDRVSTHIDALSCSTKRVSGGVLDIVSLLAEDRNSGQSANFLGVFLPLDTSIDPHKNSSHL